VILAESDLLGSVCLGAISMLLPFDHMAKLSGVWGRPEMVLRNLEAALEIDCGSEGLLNAAASTMC